MKFTVVAKNEGKYQLKICNWVLALGLVTLLSFNACRSQVCPVEAKVKLLTPRLGGRVDTPEALVKLEFKNSGQRPITIMFYATTGKGGYDEEKHSQNSFQYRFAVDGQARSTAVLSTINYQWVNEAGTQLISGCCDVCHNHIKLESGTSMAVPILIKSPSLPGNYTLTLKFDNRCLESAAYSYNTAALSWDKNGITPVFFTQSSSIKVLIKTTH